MLFRYLLMPTGRKPWASRLPWESWYSPVTSRKWWPQSRAIFDMPARHWTRSRPIFGTSESPAPTRSSQAESPRRREEMVNDRRGLLPWPVVEHSARTAAAVLASLLIARLFRLPEAYWAPITTIVITQSSLGAALEVSWQRFVGTMVGAVLGAIVASYFGPRALVFAACIFILGILSAALRVDR